MIMKWSCRKTIFCVTKITEYFYRTEGSNLLITNLQCQTDEQEAHWRCRSNHGIRWCSRCSDKATIN